MITLFKVLLGGRGFSDAQIETMAGDFSGVVLLAIMGGTSDKLTSEDKQGLEVKFKANDINGIFDFLRSKYADDAAWKAMIDREVTPLLDSYVNSVIPN